MKILLVIFIPLLVLSCKEEETDKKMMDDASEIKDETVQTSIGELETTKAVIDEFEQKTRKLSTEENKIIKREIKKLDDFLFKYTNKKSTSSRNDLKLYDEAFRFWVASNDKLKENNNEAMLILGTALGEKMVKELNMEWIVVNDKYGEDWAVQHKKTCIMAFPHSSINKRIESKETGFIEPIFYIIEKSIKDKLSKQ